MCSNAGNVHRLFEYLPLIKDTNELENLHGRISNEPFSTDLVDRLLGSAKFFEMSDEALFNLFHISGPIVRIALRLPKELHGTCMNSFERLLFGNESKHDIKFDSDFLKMLVHLGQERRLLNASFIVQPEMICKGSKELKDAFFRVIGGIANKSDNGVELLLNSYFIKDELGMMVVARLIRSGKESKCFMELIRGFLEKPHGLIEMVDLVEVLEAFLSYSTKREKDFSFYLLRKLVSLPVSQSMIFESLFRLSNVLALSNETIDLLIAYFVGGLGESQAYPRFVSILLGSSSTKRFTDYLVQFARIVQKGFRWPVELIEDMMAIEKNSTRQILLCKLATFVLQKYPHLGIMRRLVLAKGCYVLDASELELISKSIFVGEASVDRIEKIIMVLSSIVSFYFGVVCQILPSIMENFAHLLDAILNVSSLDSLDRVSSLFSRLISEFCDHRNANLGYYLYPLILRYLYHHPSPNVRQKLDTCMFSILSHLDIHQQDKDKVDHVERMFRLCEGPEMRALLKDLVSDYRKVFKYKGKA